MITSVKNDVTYTITMYVPHCFFNKSFIVKNKIALVTTASKKNTFEILNYTKKLELFDIILTSDDIKNPKPDPEGFLKAIEKSNVDSRESVIFEDSDIGIEAAKKTNATVFRVEKF